MKGVVQSWENLNAPLGAEHEVNASSGTGTAAIASRRFFFFAAERFSGGSNVKELALFIEGYKTPMHVEKFGFGKPLLCIHGFPEDLKCMTDCLEPVFETMQGFCRIYT